MKGPIDRFAEVANVFCSWLRSPPTRDQRQLHELRRLFVDLHGAVLRLPDAFDEEAPDPKDRPHEEWKKLHDELQTLPFDYYREIFDPFTDEEPVVGSLADDLADIFFDLQVGLNLYNAGFTDGAAWQWLFLFQSHWGEHLTSAQRAVHWWVVRCDNA